ncbi:MAG: hypothetical protein AAFY91_15700, partial [Bacteroidota bacterium]
SPTVWESANGPYLVTSELVVFPGASLTIEPGTEVQFQAGVGIELRSGSITANGTDESPILFTIDPTAEEGDTWRGIYSTVTPGNFQTMNFSHIVLEYAETGIKFNGGGYRNITNSTFRFNDVGVVDGDEGNDFMIFTNCDFLNNNVGTRGRASFFECTFLDNVNATQDIYYFITPDEGGRVIDCYFSNNDVCFINFETVINSAVIRNSVFENNGIVATLYSVEAENSFFIGSEIHAVYANLIDIRNCGFADNGIGLRTTETGTNGFVLNNRFENNDIGIQLDGNGSMVTGNVICNNEIGVFVATPLNVSILNNCWCSEDPEEIADQIFDAVDDVSSGLASFQPFSTNCDDPLLYPGDSNNDGQANAWDLLPIGVHYGEEGPARGVSSASWIGQATSNWGQSMINGLDLKHADADGSGLIDSDDAQVIVNNYNLTHNNFSDLDPVLADDGNFDLRLIVPEEVFANQSVSLPLEIGDASNQLNDFYGIAFAMTADVNFFNPGSFSIDLNDSWLGEPGELLLIYQELPELNRVEVAIVRRDGQPVSGYGLIANLNFVMSEDLILSIEAAEGFSPPSDPVLNLLQIEAITHEGMQIGISYKPEILVISSTEDANPVADIQ